MKATILCIIILFVLFTGCQKRDSYFELVGSMHTTYHIKYQYSRSLDEEIKQEFERYYHSLNPFDSLSVVSHINRNEAIEVDSLFIETFEKAMAISVETDGVFDITCAPLLNLWGFGFSKMEDVTPRLVDSLRTFVGFRKVRLEDKHIIKDDPRVLLSFSALGDGCICDIIAKLFDREGIANYMVEIGGEIMAKGVNPRGECWRVGVIKPVDDSTGTNQEIERILQLCGRVGFATSGDYRNFYIKDGKKYAHTINPLTGYPAGQDILSATIVASDCITADAYATSFMAMGTKAAREFWKKTQGIEYFIVFTDEKGSYRTEHSPGMEQYFIRQTAPF